MRFKACALSVLFLLSALAIQACGSGDDIGTVSIHINSSSTEVVKDYQRMHLDLKPSVENVTVIYSGLKFVKATTGSGLSLGKKGVSLELSPGEEFLIGFALYKGKHHVEKSIIWEGKGLLSLKEELKTGSGTPLNLKLQEVDVTTYRPKPPLRFKNSFKAG